MHALWLNIRDVASVVTYIVANWVDPVHTTDSKCIVCCAVKVRTSYETGAYALRIIVMGCMGSSKSSSWDFMEMIPQGASGSSPFSAFESMASRSLISCSREYRITSNIFDLGGSPTASIGNQRVSTGSSDGVRELYLHRNIQWRTTIQEQTLVLSVRYQARYHSSAVINSVHAQCI